MRFHSRDNMRTRGWLAVVNTKLGLG